MTGRVVYFHVADRPLEIREVPIAEPVGDEILVRVTACTLCRSDLHTYSGRRIEPTPTVLGHEILGRIEAFGSTASQRDGFGQSAKVGDRITWAVAVGCGDCYLCKADLPQKCERPFKYGHVQATAERPLGGGLAEYVLLVPRTAWYRVPETLSDAVATPANCATATVAAVLRQAGDVAGKRVLVMGAGVLGVTACAMARSQGANGVVAIDPNETCRERAMAFGATQTFESGGELTNHRGADVVLELAGAIESVRASLELVRIGGTVILAGAVAPVGAIEIDPEQIVRRMITLRGSHNYHPDDLGRALNFLAGDGLKFPFAELLAKWCSFADVVGAFDLAKDHSGLRVGILFGSPG